MESDPYLGELPTPYRTALELREAGADDDAIAAAVGADVSAVPALLELAHLKLAALIRAPSDEATEETP